VISEKARDSFERIFFEAVRSRLPARSGDTCAFTPLGSDAHDATPGTEVVVLTISSMVFRLLLILHFNDDERTRDYYVEDAAERTLTEAFMEVSNLCCGAMNQQLVDYFPDLGMSTPYVLSSQCVPYLSELKPDFVRSYVISVNDSLQLGATLCVCSKAPIDFTANVADLAESTGELELF
jgi:hypothetical protein